MRDAVHELTALVFAYAERLDLGDLAGVAALYGTGATYRSDYGSHKGADEVLAVLRKRVKLHDGIPRTKHVTTNLVVEVDGATATARSYFTVFQATPALPLQPIIAGRYHDRFVHDAGAWRFADRRILVDLLGDLREHLLGPMGS
jgi:3-phenylpropionate/cinnamic acid dioxygenase small subunit